MKGKFWRKALAASLALLIVTGSVPIKPISNVFESMVVTAEAVEEVTKTYSFDTATVGNDRLTMTATDPDDSIIKPIILANGSGIQSSNQQCDVSSFSGNKILSNLTGLDGAGQDIEFTVFPNINGRVTKIEFTKARRGNVLSSNDSFSMSISGMKYNGTDNELTGVDDWNTSKSITFVSTDSSGVEGNLSIILGPLSTLTFTSGCEMRITYIPSAAPVHEHSYSFNATGNKLIATCANDDGLTCSLADSDYKATLMLTSDGGHYYPDVSYSALLNLGEFNALTGLNATAGEITYTNKETGETITNYVHDIGHYTASVTISINGTDYELKKNFSIHNGTITCDYPQFSFSPETPSEGDEVTMTFTPQWGDENIQSIIMHGVDGDLTVDNGITDNGDGTYNFTMPEGALFVDAAFSAPTDEHFEQNGNTYTIKSDGGWRYFCKLIREDDTLDGFSGKTIKLAADVESSEMAGTSDHPFKGTFDGQGNTLTFNLTASEGNSAPFHYTDDATISNLHVTGLIEGGDISSLAGLVGKATGNITIENCHVSTQISTTYSGYAWHGGVIAEWNSTNATCTVTGCVYDGLIYNPDEAGVNASCRGFIGWDYGNYGTIKFTDCLSAPAAYGTGKYALGGSCFTFVDPNSEPTLTYNMTNCYYTSNLGNRQGRPATTATTAPANLGAETTDHGIVKGYENGFLYNGNYYTPKYGDAIVEYSFDDWNESASVTFNGEGDNLVGVKIDEEVSNVKSVTYNRTFTEGKAAIVILPFDYICSGTEGGTFYTFAGVNGNQPIMEDSNKLTSLTANTPYLFMPSDTKLSFPNIANMTDGYVTLQPTEGEHNIKLDDWTLTGAYEPKSFTTDDSNIMVLNNDGELVAVTDATKVSPTSGYFVRDSIKITQGKLSLNGDIGVTVGITIPTEYTGEGYHMYITSPRQAAKECNIASAYDKANGMYLFSYNVAAKEMTDDIDFTLKSASGETVYTESISVRKIALSYLSDSSTYDKEIPLVKAMLNYGAYAQEYFGYRTETLANAEYEDATIDDITADDLESYAYNAGEASNLPDGVAFESVYLSMETEMRLNMVVENTTGKELTFSVPDGYSVKTSGSGERVTVSVTGIKAENIGDKIKVNVSCDGASGYQMYSPLTYAYNRIRNKDREAGISKAMFRYYIEAKSYAATKSE